MVYEYPVSFQEDHNGTVIATAQDVPGAMTVGGTRAEALERVEGALIVVLSARIEDREPIPRPSQPARGQRTVALSPMVAAKLSIYQAMRARRMTTEDLSRRLGWEAARLPRLLDLRRRSRLEDIEAALEAMGKRLIIEVGNAA
jgi:antitoxin HicB